MTDEQDGAEQLDDDVILDEEHRVPGDDRLPVGEGRFSELAAPDEEYPPDHLVGADDPGRFGIEDDIIAREARQVPEGDG
jgi:hypothetical protein